MEEAQRLLTVSVWKLYRCRLRRGGLRLHRSLQLSLLVRAARHRYLSARAAAGTLPAPATPGATPELGEIPRCAERPEPSPGTGDHPNRPEPSPGTGQEWGNLLRDRTGDHPNQPEPTPRTGDRPDRPEPTHGTGDHRNRPTGAPRSECHRGCPPRPPAEDPPVPRTVEPPSAPDPANRNRDPPGAAPGVPRAGQKRRSSGSVGPGRGPVPSKRARLEAEAPPLPPGPPGRCSGPPAAAFGFLVRAVGAC